MVHKREDRTPPLARVTGVGRQQQQHDCTDILVRDVHVLMDLLLWTWLHLFVNLLLF